MQENLQTLNNHMNGMAQDMKSTGMAVNQLKDQ